MKKILVILALLLVPAICNASTKTVGIFLEAPPTYVSNEKVRVLIPEKTIPIFPRTLFTVLPFDQTAMAVRTYKEDNRMVINQYVTTPMNRSDIQKVGKELKCDYVLWLKVDNSPPRVGAGL